jgi:hypothetical protein
MQPVLLCRDSPSIVTVFYKTTTSSPFFKPRFINKFTPDILLPYICMMKWVTFIFTVIILTQALWPCSDNLFPVTRYEQRAHEEKHKDNGSDQCTPFCTCSCCATPSIVQLTNLFTIKLSVQTPVYSEFTPGKSPGVAMGIWQPPKMTLLLHV